MILTSETIYRPTSLRDLLGVLYRSSSSSKKEGEEDEAMCLLAAKVVYFGVGGGIAEFQRALESGVVEGVKGRLKIVWEEKRGVARSIMRIRWK